MPALKVCPCVGCTAHERSCPNLVAKGRCTRCTRAADKARGNRGYQSTGHRRDFREAVLKRDPICVVCRAAPSTVADHYPMSRRDLIDADLDPNDPDRGRGLCPFCHSRETAIHQPGGFNAR
jgi:5-methylcytosine-specific restriction protein A